MEDIDTFACSVPDILAQGGHVSDDAVEASGSLLINCINGDKKARHERSDAGLPPSVSKAAVQGCATSPTTDLLTFM